MQISSFLTKMFKLMWKWGASPNLAALIKATVSATVHSRGLK